jgi:hypothetical protein
MVQLLVRIALAIRATCATTTGVVVATLAGERLLREIRGKVFRHTVAAILERDPGPDAVGRCVHRE